ncbi:alpha/beta fold hydrolase [Brachybacterium aquaticum]|uniref:Pimeloyl-ACP methyl ester carboxylesterase n=1 Tax=Brachybacterium aquaticum TaxID=1432564 RepID=A0A841A923_9MICO|nr:alpha/beta hydrolase [Brachybacterium aquaticum]MBB5831719.1 pimeloyl-ACP methyl ester carboxylesterase [Brachybacterium aquaticum]
MTRSIVLVHAVRSSRTMWKGQVRRLRDRGYEVIAPDLPGHGRRRGEPFTLEGALATIEEAVGRCQEPPLLAGLSLGGFLTLHYAGTHPGRLAAVVAADCTIVPGPATARLYGLWMTMKDWLPGDSDARVARAFARQHTRKAARRYYGGGRAHGVIRTVVRIIGSLDLLADVAAIDVPLTFVNGEHDPFRRHESLFLEAARDGELVILEDAGHIANLSRPKRFAKVLRRCARAVDVPVGVGA